MRTSASAPAKLTLSELLACRPSAAYEYLTLSGLAATPLSRVQPFGSSPVAGSETRVVLHGAAGFVRFSVHPSLEDYHAMLHLEEEQARQMD